MAVTTKILIDTAEYERLKKVETEYKTLLQNQKGGKKLCKCDSLNDSCTCPMPLSQIINMKQQEHSSEPPVPGVLPNITDPNNDLTVKGDKPTIEGKHEKKTELRKNEPEFDISDWPKDETNWYYLGRFE